MSRALTELLNSIIVAKRIDFATFNVFDDNSKCLYLNPMTNKKSTLDFSGLPVLQFIMLWFIGWTLRITVLAAPPLAVDIRDSFLLGEAGVGALTMLPVVAIAFGAIPAAWLIHRFGVKATISGGITVMALASLARGFMPNALFLFSASIIMGFGIAAFQTALPSAVKSWTPKHVALGSAVYLNGMMVGEFSGAGLTIPVVLPLADGSWQTALVLWSIPAFAIAIWNLTSRRPKARPEVERWNPRWNDHQAWQFGLLLAGSIVVFFVINAYAAITLEKRGESHILPMFLLAFNLTPLVASVIVLSRPSWIGQRMPVALSALVAAAGLTGFILFDEMASWVLAVIAGLSATIELILLVSLPSKIAEGMGVSRLTAGMTAIGYATAFIVPLFGGWLANITSISDLALWPAAIFAFATVFLAGRSKNYSCSSVLL